ncbi:MAG TPA: addiction module protein [Chthoniobacter sp.]|nr:addiction module protein [Chthoniobacter sp.]
MSTLSEIEAAADQLPHAEKLRLMETLWAELSRKGEWVSPAWHGDALAETERRLKDGQEEMIDWQQAKAELRAKAP